MSKTKATKSKKTSASPAKSKTPKSTKAEILPLAKPSAPLQAGLAVVAVMPPNKETKLTVIIKLLTRPEGATVDDMVAATGWLKHYADLRIMPMFAAKPTWEAAIAVRDAA